MKSLATWYISDRPLPCFGGGEKGKKYTHLKKTMDEIEHYMVENERDAFMAKREHYICAKGLFLIASIQSPPSVQK